MDVICITEGWSSETIADIIAEALKSYCKRLGSANLDDSVLTILSSNSWYIAIVESSDYTDIYACQDLRSLVSFLIAEYDIDEEYDREIYHMLVGII